MKLASSSVANSLNCHKRLARPGGTQRCLRPTTNTLIARSDSVAGSGTNEFKPAPCKPCAPDSWSLATLQLPPRIPRPKTPVIQAHHPTHIFSVIFRLNYIRDAACIVYNGSYPLPKQFNGTCLFRERQTCAARSSSRQFSSSATQ